MKRPSLLGGWLKRLRRALKGAGFLTLVLVGSAQAQGQRAVEATRELTEETPSDRRIDPGDTLLEAQVRQIASELRCPVCQGLSLQDSPTELAQQIRGVIRDQLRNGRTPDEVRAFFVSKYGEWILLTPQAAGFNLIVYLLPFMALLAGAAFIVLYVRRLKARAATEPAAEAPREEELPV